MHKEQTHTLQQLQHRHVTYLARQRYCDSVGLLLSFWLKCTVCERVFLLHRPMPVTILNTPLPPVYDNDKGRIHVLCHSYGGNDKGRVKGIGNCNKPL